MPDNDHVIDFLFHLPLTGGKGAPQRDLETVMELTAQWAPEEVPDRDRAREALTAWGIEFEEGQGISRMIGTVPTLKVKLPLGWHFKSQGAHKSLHDNRGAKRMRWYVHPWDPINVMVNNRFSTHLIQLDADIDIVQVLDGTTVIHTEAVRFPHTRIDDRHPDDTKLFWTLPRSEPDEHVATNYRAKEQGLERAADWLKVCRPAYSGTPIESWL